MLFKPFINGLVDLAMPQRCAGCGRSHIELCPRCSTILSGPAYPVGVRGIPRSEFPIVAAAPYEGPARNILIAAKERNQVALIPLIARAALIAVTSLLDNFDSSTPIALVPVPSMPKNLRMRGYNLVAQMTDHVADYLRMRTDDVRVIPILGHSRQVKDQSRLTAKQRTMNLRGAFRVFEGHLPALASREVVILDDLVTTGSTLLEARRSLIAVGAKVCGAACAMSSY